jgi:hypothetical protein
MSTQYPDLIKNINNEVCSICNSNPSKICIINPKESVVADKCNLKCDQMSASTFYYDNTLNRCYCGNTKEDCKQTYASTENCMKDFTKTCELQSNTQVNSRNTDDITNSNCNDVCNKILGATGFYCDASSKCICINPNPPAPPSDYCTNNTDHLTCSNNKCIPTIDDLKNKVDEKYYKYDLGLNQDQQKAAYCGCDYDILQKYKDILQTYDVADITLSTKWKLAIEKFNEAGNTKSVHDIFQESLNLNENELRTLMAYEMCRITNDKYPNGRNSVKIVPDISQPKEWLEYYFDSSTMKTVAMILVICMLLHILFRTLFPQDGNIENSLIYAMSIPNDFMAKEKKIGAVTSLIITILLAMLIIYYTNKSSEGEQAIYWFLFITIAIGLALSIVKYFTEKDSMPLIAILILIGIFITISLVYNIFKKPSSDGIKPDGDKTDVELYEKVVRIVFYSLGSIGILLSIFLYKNSKNTDKGIISAIISIAFLFIGGIFSFNNYIKSNGQGLFDFFIPNSWNPKDFFKSGLVYSILLIIIASLGKRFQPYIIPFGLLSLSIVYTIFKKQDDTQNDKNKKIQSKWSSIMGYSWFVTVVSIILSIFGYITKKSDLLVYAITTIFGIIPLSVFFIIINFAIAIYSPIAEIVLLVIWRISGAFAIRKEGKSIGKIILLLFGKKETDKWVLPFLPWISNIIRMYYLISKDNQPDYIKYYNKYTESTGTRNTDMWFS